MLTEAEVMKEFEDAEAILRGHFVLSSGLHSDTYMQCARVLMNPARAEKLCQALAQKVVAAIRPLPNPLPLAGEGSASHAREREAASRSSQSEPCAEKVKNERESRITSRESRAIDLVVAPAMGGVVVGYEMGRQLGVNTIFCERENGVFTLRRGFAIPKGARILLVEDVVTTGKSSLETVACIEQYGGVVIAEASLVDRSGGESKKLPFPLISLLTVNVQTFSADKVPAHLQSIEAVKPGSRFLKK